METQIERTLYDRRAKVGRLINHAQRNLVTGLNRALMEFGISADQYVILAALWAGRVNTASQICRDISSGPGAITRTLLQLKAKNLICRVLDANNRRSHKLVLTEEGRCMLPRLHKASSALITQFFDDFNNDELNELERLLTKMFLKT